MHVWTVVQQNDDLLFALRMLSLGLGAWQIIDSQVFTEPKLVCVSCMCVHVLLHDLLRFCTVFLQYRTYETLL